MSQIEEEIFSNSSFSSDSYTKEVGQIVKKQTMHKFMPEDKNIIEDEEDISKPRKSFTVNIDTKYSDLNTTIEPIRASTFIIDSKYPDLNTTFEPRKSSSMIKIDVKYPDLNTTIFRREII